MNQPNAHPISPGQLKRRLNLYPPFLFNRIRVMEIAPEFRACTVRVKSSLLTRNLQGTLFGGTIYSAADAFCVRQTFDRRVLYPPYEHIAQVTFDAGGAATVVVRGTIEYEFAVWVE